MSSLSSSTDISQRSSSSEEFLNNTHKDVQFQLDNELQHLLSTEHNEIKKQIFQKDFITFKNLYSRHINEKGPSLDWNKIETLPNDSIRNYDTLDKKFKFIGQMLDKLIVIKLNGGLGTSMGCEGPKSVIQIRNELSFLDVTVQQIVHLNRTYSVNIPLVLMNSFNTDEETQKCLLKYKSLNIQIYTFVQSCYPRLNKETLLPLAKNTKVNENLSQWYPPGHGNFYECFKNCGLLTNFLSQKYEYCFLSNIDNLGATVDVNILNYLINTSNAKIDFVMEMTEKTKSDIKGGTMIQYENKLRLLELAQVPKKYVDEFKSIKKFKYFNTNNIWMKLRAIDKLVNEDMALDVIVNKKTIENNTEIIQLETAVGDGMKYFANSIGINVPRSRFLPVKTTSDLLLVMSNLYYLKHGSLLMSPERSFTTPPFIKLGKEFSSVEQFLRRFASIPDVLHLDHLTVSGDIKFGVNVSLRGTVIVIAERDAHIDIPSEAILENKIVTGNLTILDH